MERNLNLLAKQNKKLVKENKKLKKEIEKLKELVLLDFLTKIYNRRAFTYFFRKACKEVKWSHKLKDRRKKDTKLSLLILDIDNFKVFNDKYGHLAGDRILKRAARFLEKSVRGFDVVSRWGGEEFVIILEDTTLQQAAEKAEILLVTLRKKLPVTFSIGVTSIDPNNPPRKIFERADKAVYKAKKQGKNQVVVAE